MRKEDIDQVVDIHMDELPDDFLPALGIVFLREIFYPAIIVSRNAQGIVSVSGSEISGFSIIALNSKQTFLSQIF